MRFIIALLSGLIIGIAGGWYVTAEDLETSLFGSTLGSQTRESGDTLEIYGFQPFWLLESAHQNYESYISTFNYFGLQINSDGTIRKLNSAVEQEPGWTNLNTSRVKNLLQRMNQNNIKTALTVQNANEESITELLIDPVTTATTLVDEVEPILKEHAFDELNLDIESFLYAGPQKQAAFTLFVETLRNEMNERNLGELSIDVTPISVVSERLIDLEAIAPLVDTVVMMTYDYHYMGSYIAGPVAPVGGAGETREFDVKTAVTESLQVMPPDKLLLGIPTYGYEWDTLSTRPGIAVIPGTGKTITHKQVQRELLTCLDCISGRDEYSLQPHVIIPASDGEYYRQVFYEDAESLAYKIALAKQYNLRGIALWALGYEGNDMVHILQQQK
jgi:spore germination protein YaaH